VIPATPAEQRRLYDLQQVDTAIRQLEHRRAHLTEQKALDEHADTLTRVNGELATARDRLERLTLQQKRHETELAAVDSRRKSEEGRMYSGLITSPKEVDALRSELNSLKGRKNDLEDTLLEIMEQREDTESLVDELTARKAELSGQVEELTAARDAAAKDIDAELSEHKRRRDGVAEAIPADLAEIYEELLVRKDGVAVARLEGRTCLGCRLELTAIELEEVRGAASGGLARCEHCSRILLVIV
jgi:hypothetical protein